MDLAVSGGRAYLIVRYGGLHIIDVSDPKQPIEIGTFTPSSRDFHCGICAVAVVGDIAYLATHYVQAVDVSDPTAAVEVGAFDDSRPSIGVFDLVVTEGLVYAIRNISAYYPDPMFTTLDIVDFGPDYAPKLDVAIDIRPGSDSSSINPASRGVIPVAILGSETFDVADIDLATLTFGPGGATPAHRSGGHPEDVNGDGAMDLVSHFRTQETGITSRSDRVCVSGKTLDGVAFEGCGAI